MVLIMVRNVGNAGDSDREMGIMVITGIKIIIVVMDRSMVG